VHDLDDELLRHNHAAFSWALACCRWDRNLAEDVLQSAYLKVLDGRARFRGEADFRGFLFGVIRRTASEERRRRAIRSALSLSSLSLSALRAVSTSDGHSENGLDPIVRDETSRSLLAALEQLTPRQREVLHLVFYQDFTIASAAEVLGISVGSARVHYERGKSHLRRLLGDNES
jgi:RNA polymerase sigma-70 factor (ECF subfamily)